MKIISSVNYWRTLVASMAIMTSMNISTLYAAVYTNANVAADLTNATRWIGGVVPGTGATGVWDNVLSTAANCTNSTGSSTFKLNTFSILDPISDVNISYPASVNLFVNIDMSRATKDLAIGGTGDLWYDQGSGTATVTNGRTLMFTSVMKIRKSFALTLDGAGTVAYTNGIQLGWTEGPGTLNLLAGVLTNSKAASTFIVSSGGSGSPVGSTVNQSNGVNYAQAVSFEGSYGTACYNLAGGTLYLGSNMYLGNNGNQNAGKSLLNVTGGTLIQTSGNFGIGNRYCTNGATYVQSGNSTVTANVFRITSAQSAMIGNFILSNGTFYASSFDKLADSQDAKTELKFTGGVATLPAFPTNRGVNASAIVTFDGGTLSPRASTNGYLRGLTAAYMTTNGAVFDTAGYDITISQKLEDFSGHTGRLVKKGAGTLTLSGTNTYSGATIVTNGVLSQIHEQCLSASSTVYLYSTATNNLSFEGTNTIRRLYVDNVLQQEKKAYGKAKIAVLSGNGYYYVTEGAKTPGTLVSFF